MTVEPVRGDLNPAVRLPVIHVDQRERLRRLLRVDDYIDVGDERRDGGVAVEHDVEVRDAVADERRPGGHERDRRAGKNDGRECLFHADSIAMPRRPGNDEYANGLRADANGRAIARASGSR